MLTEHLINDNKQCFINKIKSITRQGAHIDALVALLEDSDFFTAPASTQYHNAFEGGLAAHSLNVYNNLIALCDVKYGENRYPFSTDTLLIVSLLHDISKINQYEKSFRNQKVYSDTGSKHDELGKYDWVSVPSYTTRKASNRFIFGSHEMNSEYIVRQYIPLTTEESVAILHHMGGMAWDSAKDNIGEVFNVYPLALLLYQADMLATYIDERAS